MSLVIFLGSASVEVLAGRPSNSIVASPSNSALFSTFTRNSTCCPNSPADFSKAKLMNVSVISN